MSHFSARASILLFSIGVACSGSRNDARHEVARALTEHLGEAADPKVGYLRDSTHLKVDVATVAFPTRTEEDVTDHAHGIARFTYCHYEQASRLDSISVFYLEKIRRGAWWVRHTRSFAAAELANGNIAPI